MFVPPRAKLPLPIAGPWQQCLRVRPENDGQDGMGKASSAAISAFSAGSIDTYFVCRGMGLGKSNSGITTHVVVNKKDEAQGVSSCTFRIDGSRPSMPCLATDWLQRTR